MPPTGEPLRVCYVTHRFPHATETFVAREMAALVADGVELTITSLMAPRTAGAPDEAPDLLGRVRYARSTSWLVIRANFSMLGRRPIRYLRSIRGMLAMTWREPKVMLLCLALFPRAVYFAEIAERQGVHHLRAHFVWIEGIAAGIIRELTGIRYSVNPHAFGLFTRPPADVRALLEDADLITTISDYNRRFIRDLCPDLRGEVGLVRCGVDLVRYEPRPAERADGPLRLLSIGRAVEKKGHDVLLRACRLLVDWGIQVECRLVAGSGGLRPELDALVGELGLATQVMVLDSVPEREVRDMLRWADVFVLACRVAQSGDRDGIPVVLMEAMASTLPVVTTDVSGIPELVEDGVDGAVVPPDDPVALAEAIADLGSDPDRGRAMGIRGRERVRREFLVEPNVRRLEELIAGLDRPMEGVTP
jgi:glycosyltransferase involved in cell wall biosynthesis